ncbi:hypothetical protein [Methanoculleus bourgensis]|nr:hypothetical protein [Methanoculleus bourgensis]
MKGGAEERMAGEPGPVTFTCYRITPGEEESAPGEEMNAYSVVVLLPGGEFRHQVVWAGPLRMWVTRSGSRPAQG